MECEAEDENKRDTDVSGLRLTTARLVMRSRQESDLGELAQRASDPLLADACPARHDRDPADLALVIVERHGRAIIGEAVCSGLADMRAPVEIGLWLAPERWGVGYGTEAVHALVDWAFADGRTCALWSSIRVTNARARRVLEKSGFQHRGGGMRPGAVGGPFPVERFVLDRRNWASLRAWGGETLPELRRRGAA